jgi:hypothetical protein
VLDQVKPIQQLQSQVQVIQQAGQTLVEGYNLTKELLTKDSSIENLQRTTEVQPDSRDAFERLREATGTEPSTTSHDALERLSKTVGMDRTDPIADLNQTLDKPPVQKIAPALEPVIEEHALEESLAPILGF